MSDAKPTVGPYYAKDGMVWKHPIHQRHDDGSETITIGFPVCKMHEAVGVKSAATVAELMNLGDANSNTPRQLAERVEVLEREKAELVEQCAKIAESETITGIPPLDWPLDKIEACEATCRATAKSIARKIRTALRNATGEAGGGT